MPVTNQIRLQDLLNLAGMPEEIRQLLNDNTNLKIGTSILNRDRIEALYSIRVLGLPKSSYRLKAQIESFLNKIKEYKSDANIYMSSIKSGDKNYVFFFDEAICNVIGFFDFNEH